MTVRQSFLKIIYPLLVAKNKWFGGNNGIKENKKSIQPITSFYNLKTLSSKGEEISFEQFKGKKLLLVNTASDCGFTAQYDELQKLYEKYQQQIVIIAFPANDFKEQEKKSDEEIESFCKLNYGVTFSLMKKSSVIKSGTQNEVFTWLTNSNLNGWNNTEPSWNFCKYLVNENGVLTSVFPSAISPLSKQVIDAIAN